MEQLRLQNLKKSINGDLIINIEDIVINEPGIYGIIGPNGAGKTTLLKCICGLLRPDEGEIYIEETPLSPDTRSRILKNIGSVFAQSEFLLNRSASEVLEEHYYYYALTPPQSWDNLLSKVHLQISYKMKLGAMSLGMRQKFLLAVALSHHPKILILDEPFNGLDVDTVESITKTLINFARTNIVIVTSHVFEDLGNMVSSIAVMNKGYIGGFQKPYQINGKFSDGIRKIYNDQIKNLDEPF
ncbi:ABC transporter ATP-binding protein [Lentilactobacillus fungorum]|uniref:ABC transporter ATP-binding protein n=1 Tax=Lentilactobacillus fungorum TaxID=2201250 RepID=A0ABQ3VYU8_9LACO|nr:ATP-binding cassette domain-containing protein [Lentilactobacillus fungorum]GHP13611.1 ABC transporter ATP-binding protein [Lentilactobacillus fungorum]